MAGMNCYNGKTLDGVDHIQQSLQDILTTPIGSRVMRRDYGSALADLIDQPLNAATLLQCSAAAVMAIAKWEPRVTIDAITPTIDDSQPGRLQLLLKLTRLDTGTPTAQTVNINI